MKRVYKKKASEKISLDAVLKIVSAVKKTDGRKSRGLQTRIENTTLRNKYGKNWKKFK